MNRENAPVPTANNCYTHRRPPSPTQQQQQQQQPSPLTQISPSTARPSPQQTPGPLDANSAAESSGRRGMRSQIACARCRRSKTKCENLGVDTTCKACANAKRDCVWDHTAVPSTTGSLRRDSTADFDPPKKRRKVIAPTTAAHRPTGGLGTYEDALDSPLLTAQVWEELFDIYEKHFSIDFPFLHKRTFLSAVQQQQPAARSSDAKPSMSSPMAQPYAPLLLAFLTQTARFHKQLVKQMDDDPIKTAEFYAQATRIQMGSDIFGKPTLEMIQTLLMLGYYEWTALQGTQGWIKVGTAIRCAIVLGYPHLDIDDKDGTNLPKAFKEGENGLSGKDQFILRETQRRTFWSCYLLDCYLSWGKNRPSMLRLEHFQRTQLVCSDGAFNFGRRVRTRLLGEDDATYGTRRTDWHKLVEHHQSEDVKWEVGDTEAELTWYIKVVDVFGEIAKWSCNRGRRQEGKIAPWSDETTFKKLEDKLKRLKNDLPDHLQLTTENTEDRIYNGSGKYVSIHAMYTVCFIWLYREYMPSRPWTLSRPTGPNEEPLIEEPPPDPEYWVNQAKVCARVCKDFTDLLHTISSARSNNNLVETPIVAFACYSVAICTVYCHYFPAMDPDGLLTSSRKPKAHDVANEFLVSMLHRFKMAKFWILEIARWQIDYRDHKRSYKEVGGQVSDSPKSSTSDGGGGLKDYSLLFEESHKQFGSLNTHEENHWTNKDIDLADSRLPQDNDSAERTLPPITALKQEKKEVSEDVSARSPSQSKSFTAINQNVDHANQTRSPSGPQLPMYEPQVNSHSYHTNSTPQYRPQASPTNVPFQYGTQSHPQNSMPVPLPGLQPNHNHGHFPVSASVETSAAYPTWGLVGQPGMRAARMEMEQTGAQTFQNELAFGIIMAGDMDNFNNGGTPWDLGMRVPFDNTNNNNNMGNYYPPGSGQHYPYQQHQ